MPRRKLEEPKSKPSSDLKIKVLLEAPWGESEINYIIKNAKGNIPPTRRKRHYWDFAIWRALQKEFGEIVKQA